MVFIKNKINSKIRRVYTLVCTFFIFTRVSQNFHIVFIKSYIIISIIETKLLN